MLDTNVIYNVSACELLRDEVGELIKASSSHPDLIITWYLPEIVRNEREHHLRELARESLPSNQKLERVLGLNFGITEQMIIDRVRQRIDSQIHQLNLRILPVDPSGVDWVKMMSDAAFRQPPFSPGKHEKGFRDAVIVEAVGQLVASSSTGRIAVVTGDELLTKAVITKTSSAQNVHVLSSIEELKGLINTLVSNVDEAFIQQMKTAAASFFFEPDNRESYIYKEEIKDRILRDFHSLIHAVPAGMNEVERGKALVSRPRFKEKIGDRMYWVSRIAFRMKAYSKDDASSQVISVGSTLTGYSGYSGYSGFAGYSPITDETDASDIETWDASSIVNVPVPVYKVSRLPSKIGHVAFEVTWSVIITPQHQLTTPKVESIHYVETSWD